jgi:hypothetical protein
MSSGGSVVANIELKVVHTDPNNTSQKETAAGGDGTLFGLGSYPEPSRASNFTRKTNQDASLFL